MATDSAPWAWARQPSVFLAAALSTKVRSVTSLTLLVRRAPLAQCHQRMSPAWVWTVTTGVTVPDFTTVTSSSMSVTDLDFQHGWGFPDAVEISLASQDRGMNHV